MNTKFILSFLRIGSTVMFYVLIVITGLLLAQFIYKAGFSKGTERFIQVDTGSPGRRFMDISADNDGQFEYSADNLLRYKRLNNLYNLEIQANSAAGYYYISSTLVFLGLGLTLLWNFKKVFTAVKLPNPFTRSVVKRLRLIALIFILSDILSLVHYFILGSLLKASMGSNHLKLMTDAGNGIVIGLIILVIAVIYQRGLEIYEENNLTV